MTNTLEEIGIALIAVRIIGQGINEEMARDGADDDYEPVGEFRDVFITVRSEEYLNLSVKFTNGEYEDDSHAFTRGEVAEDVSEDIDIYAPDDWENPLNKPGVVYTSQILASMTYGSAPYAPGSYNVKTILQAVGIHEFNYLEPEKLDYENYQSIPNVKADVMLNKVFLEEAKNRGIDPMRFEAISYSMD